MSVITALLGSEEEPKEGQHLGGSAGKGELSGGAEEQLDPVPRSARKETGVRKSSLKYGGSCASQGSPEPALL